MKTFWVSVIALVLASTTFAAEPAPSTSYRIDLTLSSGGKFENITLDDVKPGATTPLSSVRQIDFVKSITASDRGTAAETATLTVGLSATFSVKPADDGMIAVHYAIAHSTLNSLNSIAVAGGQVQLPDVSQDSTEQDAVIASGGTIVGQFGAGKDVTYRIKVSTI